MQTLKTRTLAILGAVLVGTAGLATVAHADVPKMRIPYCDLDTASAAGQKRLVRRIARAAAAVCSVHDVDALLRTEAVACRDRAVSNAYSDLAGRGVMLR